MTSRSECGWLVALLLASLQTTGFASVQTACDQLNFSTSYYNVQQPTALVSGDWNQDGTIDIAASDVFLRQPWFLQMLLNDGAGNFAYRGSCTFPFRSAFIDLVAGDFNSDDTVDVVLPRVGVAFPGPNALQTMIGSRRFAATCVFQYTGCLHATGTDFPDAITAGHFNNDNLLDVAVVGLESGTAGVMLNTTGQEPACVISFGSPSTFPVGSAPRDLAARDVNGDGKLDLVVAVSGEDSIKVFLGLGDGAFNTIAFSHAVGDSPVAIVTGFFDTDGRVDVAVANYKSNTVSVLLGGGDGTFIEAPGSPIAAGTGPVAITAADIYSHGRPDLAVANRLSNTMTVLYNANGNFAIVAPCSIPIPNGPAAITTGDYDGDGKADIATGSDNFDVQGDFDTTAVFLNLTPPVAVGDRPRTGAQLGLGQNSPNPFADATAFRFTIPAEGPAHGEIFDLAGHRIRTFADGVLPGGNRTFVWDGTDERGQDVPTGVYYYRLRWRAMTAVRRAVLIR